MDRRRFLRNLLSGATVVALGPALLHGADALAGDPAEFSAGLVDRPYLAGWRQVSANAFGPTTVQIEGRLPANFAGTLYRNGPAWFERDGFRYEHWFDGDGMVHGWRFGDGAVTHRGRMVQTPKFQREQRAGRFNTMAAGTTVPGQVAIRNNDDANTANTSVVTIGGRLFAMSEAGSAFELDPDALDTIGPVTWRPDLQALPFSANPLRDRDGSWWNFGALSMLGGSGLLLWHIGADASLIGAHVLEMDAPGYLHAFVQTDRHLVFLLMPYDFTPSGSFFESMRFAPQRACTVLVVEKAAPDRVARRFEVDFAMAYHFGDAFERAGEIVVRTVHHRDVEHARSPHRAAMSGHDGPAPAAQLAELRLDVHSGRARWDLLGVTGIEFPLFDARTPGDRSARLYMPTTEGETGAPYFNAVQMLDPASGRRDVHRYGRDILAEEHVFVPRPGSTRPDDGWLVGTVLDPTRNRSGIAVLDAQHIANGPLATAWLPYAFPLGFHGHFAQTGA
ncbi:carotenoid oxygenase family protein [Luteimonas fraxinea]|uniref:Carotenoid oxygenase family protein n=1 Tax=Luteimonas fraxinea TaxID=2901869 RepID=A0ABS8UF03_9GAMM|nr:carotenoid oxygenase family protein [Luteimonas fraxinea]MCD9097567.1 carotenoid oxygenase family protein [Luteimonas fraxinea]UHH08467.1 carotenoid oxygenase family protein [Luteimonas fraxinea]